MGWGDCGTDTKGRPIGYLHEGGCDEPGCTEKVYRGIDAACGGMHGTSEVSCEGYFCAGHRHIVTIDGKVLALCAACRAKAEAAGLLADDDESEVL